MSEQHVSTGSSRNGRTAAAGVAAVLATAALALTLSGCAASPPRAAGAAEPPAASGVLTDVVTAVGSGKTTVAPDRAVMTFSVSRRGNTSRQALNAVDAVSRKIRRGVTGAGIPQADLQTANVSLSPIRDKKGKVTSYAASLSLQVTVRDIAKLGDVVEGGTIAGADDFYGPQFYVSQENSANRDALRAAVEDARGRAEVMARAGGRSIGEVVVVTESSSPSPYGPEYGYRSALAKDSMYGVSFTPEPGTMDVRSQATVTFRLK